MRGPGSVCAAGGQGASEALGGDGWKWEVALGSVGLANGLQDQALLML